MLGYAPIGQFTIGEIGTSAGSEIISVDKWFQAFSEPPRFRAGLKAGQQAFAAAANIDPVVSFSWFEQLSEPPRFERLPISNYPFAAFNPQPFVSFGWFNELSKPSNLARPSLAPANQQFFAFNPLPRVSFGWFEPLSEPVRFKTGLRASLQQFLAMDTSAIPISKLIAWFEALSEPPRFKQGLRASLQQFYAGPAQLRPTPTTFMRLDATETKDVLLGAISVWNRIVSGEVGVIEMAFTGAEIGAVTTVPSVGTSGVVKAMEAGSGGAAIPTIGRAGVSIRII